MSRLPALFTIVLWIFILPALALIALAVYGVYYATSMPGSSHQGSLPLLTLEERDLADRLRRHVTAIASKEHNVDHYEELEQSARYIEETLTGYGYRVKRQVFDSRAGKVRNLEAVIPGPANSGKKRQLVVVGAHYDSAPGAVGANDNGSGSAAVLELARLLKDAKPGAGYELRLVLFVNEEPPYFKTSQMGSWVYAGELRARGERVAAMLSLETLGYYSENHDSQQYPFPLNLIYPDTANFVGFVGTLNSRALVHKTIASFRKHTAFPSEGIAAPASVPGVDWSDHWAYLDHGYPAMMNTDTAFYRYPHYHTQQDTPDKLDYERLARVVKGIEGVVRELAHIQ